jgi:thiol-disulfide isomerase/thioredoxin
MTSPETSAEPKPPQAEHPAKRLLIPAVVLIAAAAVYWFVIAPLISPPVMPKPEVHAGVGQPLAYLELQPLTGDASPISLPDLQNHVTLLNFWGTWCPPCRNELPHLAQLHQRFAGQEAFRLLAVSCPAVGQTNDVQSLQEETAALLKRLDVNVPTYSDPDGGTEFTLRKLVATQGYPTTVLLDRRGVIRAVWVGYRPGAETEMERYISKLLDEENAPNERHHGGTENTERRKR